MKKLVPLLIFIMLFQNIAFAQLDVSQAITVSGNKDFYEIKDDQIYKISNTDDDTFQPPVSLFSTMELEDKYLSEYITTPKDQKNSGDCWAFATCGAMETALIKNGFAQNNIDLSENHVKYVMSEQYGSPYGFDIGVGLGGIPPMYKSYLLYGPGLVNDDKCPHTVNDIGEDYAITANYPIIDYMASGIIELPNLTDKLGYNETKQSRIIEVKKLIKEYGAVFASIYYDQSNTYLKDNKNFYYTANEDGKYEGTNHTVLLVGWDDNYSKENFKPVNGECPAENGAFVIKNSWGTEIGDNGLFYISYCDMYACEEISCISGVREKCGNESLNSYTGGGNVSADLAFTDESGSYFNVLYYGNIFKRNYADEKLKSVMLYLMPGYSYDVSVVFADEVQSSEGYVEFLGDVTEETLFSIECPTHNGYYTYNLNKPLNIPKDIYAIRVKIKDLNEEAAVIPIEVPCPVVIDNQLKVMKDITSNPLESFVNNEASNCNIDLNSISFLRNYGELGEISYRTNTDINTITTSEKSKSQIDYMSIVNEGNQKITSFEAGSTVKIAPVVNGINLNGKDLVCAVYNGNLLVKTFMKTIENNENIFEYENIPSDFSNYEIKAFVLDLGENKVTPLGNVKIYE